MIFIQILSEMKNCAKYKRVGHLYIFIEIWISLGKVYKTSLLPIFLELKMVWDAVHQSKQDPCVAYLDSAGKVLPNFISNLRKTHNSKVHSLLNLFYFFHYMYLNMLDLYMLRLKRKFSFWLKVLTHHLELFPKLHPLCKWDLGSIMSDLLVVIH